MSKTHLDRVRELAKRREDLIANLRLRPTPDGLDWVARHTELADETLRLAYDSVPDMPELAVVATGGYGRAELAPFSDVDLTVIPLDETDPKVDAAVRTLWRTVDEFFGVLGLRVGYAYRLIGDAPGLDPRTRTSLLDARWVAGSHRPLELLLDLFWQTFPAGDFLIDKIAERAAQFRKTHDTPLVVEPHLKEGAGGLRCFHCANWIGAAIGERPSLATREVDHVLQVRNLLHAMAEKATDLLTRQRQAEICEVLETTPFEMGSRLAESMLALHAEFTRATERIHEARFRLSDRVMALRGEARVEGPATASEAATGIAAATRLGLRVADIATVTSGAIDGGQALATLSGGEAVLRNLDRCGVLDALLPEVTRCRTLMPEDSAHTYTVFEHTFRAIRFLDSLGESQGFLADVFASLPSPSELYLALLLHDAGKAVRGRPHSESGEDLAREVGQRWRVPEQTIETVAWLVRHHLEMARFIRMRDVHHPDTIREFARIVGGRDRLAMLTLLTWADVSAVGPQAWTPAQDAFLRDLYEQTSAALGAETEVEPDPGLFRQRILKRLAAVEIPEEDLERFVASLPAHYLLSTAPELIREHFHFARRAREGEPTIELFQRDDLQATEVTVCCPDAPGLLSRVLGVFYALDLAPIGLRACTTEDEVPVALDVFTVTFGERALPRATCAVVAQTLEEVVRGRLDVSELLRTKGKDPDRSQEVFQRTFHPGLPAILEIRAPRGRGMAYRISRQIAAQGWNILAARVGQWAGQGAAAFYVTGAGGSPLAETDLDAAFGVVEAHAR